MPKKTISMLLSLILFISMTACTQEKQNTIMLLPANEIIAQENLASIALANLHIFKLSTPNAISNITVNCYKLTSQGWEKRSSVATSVAASEKESYVAVKLDSDRHSFTIYANQSKNAINLPDYFADVNMLNMTELSELKQISAENAILAISADTKSFPLETFDLQAKTDNHKKTLIFTVAVS